MTTKDRTLVAETLWDAVRRLVPHPRHRNLEALICSLETVYGDHAIALVADERSARVAAMAEAEAAAHQAGFESGMLAVEGRADRRDPLDVQDPEELRSVH
jgi:hypothetical protein